jgi:hypothetical protein
MNGTRGTIVEELGSGTLEVFPLPVDEATLTSLVTDIFADWWEHIHFGVIVQGAAWEVAAPNAPLRISSLDGYITVNFGRWHFHLCIGEHTASGPELGRIRRCARAELYRILYDGRPGSWGVRLFNGEGTQLMTVLPHPWLSDTQQPLSEPQWDRLAAWDALRARYLGIEPEPLDRTATGFSH